MSIEHSNTDILLVNMARNNAKRIARREWTATLTHSIRMDQVTAQNEADLMRSAVHYVHVEFSSLNVILFPDSCNRVVYPSQKSHVASLRGVSLTVAQWAFKHKQIAGHGTKTLSGASAIYIPFGSQDNVLGVLVLMPLNQGRIFLAERQESLENFLQQFSDTLIRIRVAEQAKLTAMQKQVKHLPMTLPFLPDRPAPSVLLEE